MVYSRQVTVICSPFLNSLSQLNNLSLPAAAAKPMAEALISVLIEELGSMSLQWIREEVRLVKDAEKDVGQLKSNLTAIQAVLEDAEKKQLTDRGMRDWLEKLKDASFEIDNVLDDWNTAFLKFKIQKEGQDIVPFDQEKKVCCSVPSPFSCFTSNVNRFTLRHEIARKIKDMNEKLDGIAAEKDRYKLNTTTAEEAVIERPKTTSFIDETEIYGRDEDKEAVISKLLCESSTDQQDQGLVIIPIVGMGGLGKTALAQLIYNDEKVGAHFDKLIWVCVSDPFDVMKVATAIIEDFEREAPNFKELQTALQSRNIKELQTALQRVRECIEGKRFLLVLDDAWTKDNEKWEQLKQPLTFGAVGSRILVTTRKEEVAIMMGVANRMISPKKLSEEHSWLVFKRRAFLERKEEDCRQLEEIGRKIASKSKGLPLVAKTLGSLMCFKKTTTQWEAILDSELWNLGDVKEVFAPFLLSYHDLSSKEKRCFLYCSIFPKDHRIDRDELIELWLSQNYLKSEEDGHECFENLVMRSFFQNFKMEDNDGSITHCKMHDIVHDFAQFLMKTECITMEVDNVEEKPKTLEERARHLTLVVGAEAQFPTLKYNKMNEQNLHTLFIVSKTINNTVDGSLFLQLRCLRTLKLGRCGLTKLPESICRLIHLRYLSLRSNHGLDKLPDTLCDLCNLQTLDLRFCFSLGRLPGGIRKLVNLRHLHICGCLNLEGLPKGIGRLTGLRKLDMLVVPENKNAYFDIGNLRMLRNLRHRGFLHIKGCGNVGNADEAEKVDLKNSSQVSSLQLDFGRLQNRNGIEKDVDALELFEPHQNLLGLDICRYWGATVSPRWMMSLTNLRGISLVWCPNCEILPSLGKLPSLEFLDIRILGSLKRVGVEFLGITEKGDEEEGEGSMKRIDSSKSPIISFPKLKTLWFNNLKQWEIWEATTTAAESSSIIMPCLAHLEFVECPSLQALPDFLAKTTSLKELVISSSEILEQWCQTRVGEEWEKISHAPNIKVNDKYARKDGVWIQEASGGLERPSTSE